MERIAEAKRIKQLSRHLINQIAAGEVIERPASVVKELVENSIDAGASAVEIEVSNGCLNIRVSDNGTGINPEDIELAFTKHATSKLATSEDLFDINTLGFRGEALASIISISKLVCTTRTKENTTGIKVECEESQVKKQEAGCAIGTTMEVKELFYNTPVRAKFLKSERAEFSNIAETLQSLAIARPDVALTLINKGSTPIHTSGSGDLLCTLTEIYSNSIASELKEINKTDELSKLHVYGYCSTPNFTRSSKKSIYVFVNNRVVKCPVLLKAIDMAYKNMLATGKYPFVVLNLELKNSDVDVNVHPTKKEVRYRNPNQIFNFVMTAINEALSTYKPQQEERFTDNSENRFEQESNDYEKREENVTRIKPTSFLNAPKEDDAVYVTRENIDELTVKNSNIFSKVTKQTPHQNTSAQINFEIHEQPVAEPNFNIIGQYRNTYIIFEEDKELKIVDQHIADERYIFEKLTEELDKNISSQLLLISDVIKLEPADASLLEENKDKLEKFGYEIQAISDTEIVFKKVPQVISHIKTKEILSDILENLTGDINKLEEKMLVTISCKAAVKAGQELNLWQMEELIKKWKTTKHPYTCPHGRPIIKTFKEQEIAGFFDRNV